MADHFFLPALSRPDLSNRQGIGAIIIAALLWSVVYFIEKRVVLAVGPFTITFVTALSGALLTGIVYRITPRMALSLLRQGGWPMVLLSFCGVTVANSLLMYGFRTIDLGIASLLEKTQPIFTVMLAALFLKEKLSARSIVFGLFGLVGAAMIVPAAPESHHVMALTWQTGIGVAAVIGAAISWAAAGVLGRKLAVDDLGPANMAFLRASIGAVTCLPFCLIFEPRLDLAAAAPALGFIGLNGFFDSVLGYVLYYRGMKVIAAGTASIIEFITPVGAVLLGVGLLGEHLTMRQLAGAVIVLTSVTLLVWNEIRHHAKAEQKNVAAEFKP